LALAKIEYLLLTQIEAVVVEEEVREEKELGDELLHVVDVAEQSHELSDWKEDVLTEFKC
jgi:hypothetical protein